MVNLYKTKYAKAQHLAFAFICVQDMSYIFRPVKMELDFLASLEEAADINQIRQETIDPNNFEVDQTSEIEEHLAVASLEPLYLGVLLCLGSWYLVGFSTPIQSVLALKKHPRTFMKIHPLVHITNNKFAGKEDKCCTARSQGNSQKRAEKFPESSRTTQEELAHKRQLVVQRQKTM